MCNLEKDLQRSFAAVGNLGLIETHLVGGEVTLCELAEECRSGAVVAFADDDPHVGKVLLVEEVFECTLGFAQGVAVQVDDTFRHLFVLVHDCKILYRKDSIKRTGRPLRFDAFEEHRTDCDAKTRHDSEDHYVKQEGEMPEVNQ